MKNNFILYGLIILSMVPLISATPGTIEGTVRDEATGRPLPGANVILPGTTLGAAADMSGFYTINHVPAGHYTIQASMMGYKEKGQYDIVVEAHRSVNVDFTLREKVIQTESVLVSDSYFDRSTDAVSSSHTFSSREIQSSPGSAEDVFRILKNIPGVATSGSISANLIVRGGNPNENLTLLDHLEIKSPLHFSREDMSMGIISIIDPAMIKNVEFITGGFPAEYGDKLSSVFELNVKEGNRSQFNHDLNLSMAGFNAYLDGPISEHGSMIFSVRRGIFDLFTKMMGRKVEPRYWDMLGKVTMNPEQRHQISLIGFYYKDDAERRETMEDHGALARRYEYMNWEDYGSAIGLNWRFLYCDNGYALTTLEWSSNGNVSNVGHLSDRDLNGDDILVQNIQLKTRVSYKLSPQLIMKTGVSVKRISSDYTRWREADTLKTGFIVPGFSRVYQLPFSYQTGVFIQGEFRPTARLMISPGIRFDACDRTHESYWSPRLGVVYCLTDQTTLNAACGVYHQTPSALFLSMDEENLRLKSSKAVHTVLGIEHLLSDDTRISLEAYYKDLRASFVSNDTTLVIHNEGLGYSKGLEFTLQKKMKSNLMASLAYTWSVSKRQDSKNSPEYDFDYDRRHNFTMMAACQLSDAWRLGVKYQYASGNPYTPVIGSIKIHGEWFVVEGMINADRFPDYHSLDIRADRAFRFSGWTLNVYLEVWNLFNYENVLDYYYGIDQNGEITKNAVADFPLMPMFGLNIQF